MYMNSFVVNIQYNNDIVPIIPPNNGVFEIVSARMDSSFALPRSAVFVVNDET